MLVAALGLGSYRGGGQTSCAIGGLRRRESVSGESAQRRARGRRCWTHVDGSQEQGVGGVGDGSLTKW